MPNRSAYLAYIYLLRIPILAWIALSALVALALTGSPVVRGLFDLSPAEAGAGVLLVRFWLLALAATLASTAMTVTSWLVLVWGDKRFAAGEIERNIFVRWSLIVLALLPAAALFAAAYFITETSASELWRPGEVLGGGALGFASALVVYGLARWIRRWAYHVLIPALLVAVATLVCVVFRFFGMTWGLATIVILVLLAYAAWSFAGAAKRHVGAEGRSVTSGYLNDQGTLDKGHMLAGAMMTLSFIAYALIGQARFGHFGGAALLPTLGLVIIGVMLACYVLAGAAFFLDFFRIPLLLVLSGYAVFVAQSPEGDHFYRALPAPHPARLPPSAVLQAGGRRGAIVVSATGGGIQASGWTAQALTGIAQLVEKVYPGQFAPMVRLVSSVSGGSVGAMYFIQAYQPDGTLPAGTINSQPVLQRVVDGAEASSLDELAYGLIYIDLWRGLFPFGWQHAGLLAFDRGYWLENAWKRELWAGQPYHAKLPERLSDWRSGVRAGTRPAVIFNSTFAETGERFLMGTSDLDCPDWTGDQLDAAHGSGLCAPKPKTGGPTIRGTRQFYDEYDGVDVHPATAARLSATFPFVTAAARIDQGGCCTNQFHAVDGGYYDNYGMATLAEWLEQALHDPGEVTRILVIQLRSSPPNTQAEPEGSKGWFFQTLAPLVTLSQVSGTTQLSRNGEELYLLSKLSRQVTMQTAVFSYNWQDPSGKTDSPPLSWHLTQAEKENIHRAWKEYERPGDDAMGEVWRFFYCVNHPANAGCAP